MPTVSQYIQFADDAYNRKSEYSTPVGEDSDVRGYEVQRREWATALGNGLQGVVYRGTGATVVAFAGTMGNLRTAPISQNTANLRIGLQIVPNMAGSAFRMVRWAQRNAGGNAVSVVGHSLGGAMAQLAGYWANCPFVSFNGPGMKGALVISALNVLAPMQMARTLRAVRSLGTEVPPGYCFVVGNDFVGNYGPPMGEAVRLPVVSFAGTATHGLDAVRRGVAQLNRLNEVLF